MTWWEWVIVIGVGWLVLSIVVALIFGQIAHASSTPMFVVRDEHE